MGPVSGLARVSRTLPSQAEAQWLACPSRLPLRGQRRLCVCAPASLFHLSGRHPIPQGGASVARGIRGTELLGTFPDWPVLESLLLSLEDVVGIMLAARSFLVTEDTNSINEEDFSLEEESEDQLPLEYDIASYPSDLTLSVIHEMWMNKDIIIPDFQREFVWTIRQSSLLIDSFCRDSQCPKSFFI